MTPSEIFGQEKFLLAASAESLYAFFLLFSSLGPIRPSGGFSDLQKRQDFEGRAPRRHKSVGFGTYGSPTTIRFKRNVNERRLCIESECMISVGHSL